MGKKQGIYLITWMDAVFGSREWKPEHEAAKEAPALCYTVGFIAKRNKSVVVVVHTVGGHPDDDSVAVAITIPAPWVKSIKKIGSV